MIEKKIRGFALSVLFLFAAVGCTAGEDSSITLSESAPALSAEQSSSGLGSLSPTGEQESKIENPPYESKSPNDDNASEIQEMTPPISSEASASLQTKIPNDYSRIPTLKIDSFYTRNSAEFTYVGGFLDFSNADYWNNPAPIHSIYTQRIVDGLAAFEGLEPVEGNYQITGNEFLIWTTDGVRHVYGIGQNGYFIADGKAYILPDDKRKIIDNLHEYILSEQSDSKNYNSAAAYPQWLVWMTPSRITEIVYHSPTRGALTIAPALVQYAAWKATLSVEPKGNSNYSLGSIDFSGNNVFHIEIRFDGGIVYNIYAINSGYGADYYVQSSDMSFGCKYSLLLASVDGAATFLINDFEFIADAKSVDDVMNPAT